MSNQLGGEKAADLNSLCRLLKKNHVEQRQLRLSDLVYVSEISLQKISADILISRCYTFKPDGYGAGATTNQRSKP